MNSSLLGYGTLVAVVIGVVVGVVVFNNSDDVADAVSADVAEVASEADAATLKQLNFRLVDYGQLGVMNDEFGRLAPGMDGENIVHTDKALKTETVNITLPLDGKTEIKAVMQTGDAIVYEWQSSANTYYDYHAHQPGDVQVEGYFTRYAEGEGTLDRGAMVAPYTGEHGWYYMNLSDGPVDIELTISGYYDEIVQYDLGG